MSTLTAADVSAMLDLEPHPEGGFYRQTFADRPDADGRPVSTLIYYMLTDHQTGLWHRVDAAEVWHWYAGAPMLLRVWDGLGIEEFLLGNDLLSSQRPQRIIPAGAWQQAKVLGDWSLVGCTVAPGFLFSKFEEAAPGWEPG